MAILEFLSAIKGKNIKITSDNTTVVYYLNKMGGTRSKPLCDLTIKIWKILLNNSINCWSTHISGVENNVADFLSRHSHNHEFALKMDTFQHLTSLINFRLEIDMFASKNNKKLRNYVSLFDDPLASNIDAFSFSWPSFIYVFPPIPLIDKALLKTYRDNVDYCLFITPAWNTLPVIPLLIKSLISRPILIPFTHLIGRLPCRHPFYLMAWPISGSNVKNKGFQINSQNPCSRVLPQEHLKHMKGSGTDLLNGLMRKEIFPICLSI